MVNQECRTAGIGCVDCKKLLAKNINAHFVPFREKRAELSQKPEKIWEILEDGAGRARVIAAETIREVRDAIGMP
jgi:tryptophanyl-tRNA synthetase